MGIADWFYPKRCLGCGMWGEYVCRSCAVGVWEEEQICPTCGRVSKCGRRHVWCKEAGLDGVVCMYAYGGMVKKVIETMKYKRCFDPVNCLFPAKDAYGKREDLAEFLNFAAGGCVAVPVPLWPIRERERGFNQAEIIAKKLAQECGVREANLLIRTRDTGRQVGRSRTERLQAVKSAFALRVRSIRDGDGVVIVDDVWTTGATMRECGRVLKKAGFVKVWGFALAR